MYRGTFDGDKEEQDFVRRFNSTKFNFKNYISKFSSNHKNLWMIRVTTKQFSKLSNKKVFTRSDCYLVNIKEDINDILLQNNFYLSEEILDNKNILYEKICNSGISIKMATSKNFQIIKLGPNSFNNLFNSFELGAGASLFCLKENELIKNLNLITGWNTTLENMAKYFHHLTYGDLEFYLNQKICKEIKEYSSNIIKKIVENEIELQKKIFNGIGLYDEPYTAHYLYHGNNISTLEKIPFYVTTGSGRSKGDYTIVLKPISSL